MKGRAFLFAAVAGGGVAVAAASAAVAQGVGGGMGPGMMMGSGMIQGGMGPGTMQGGTSPGMTGSGDGMGAMFGGRIDPGTNLSVEDVSGYLAGRLERLGNKRLRVGEVKADGATITADIVTIENSLVQRLRIDRRTGVIDYQN